jgi:hypothetical protein
MALLVRGGLTPLESLEVINGSAALVIGSAVVEAGVTPGSEPIEPETIVGVYAGLSPDDYPILSRIMGSAGAQQFDPERQFEDLLDAYVRGLEARIGERG